ncbi:MAG: metallophosphoesterase family protein [Acidobacteria bacterium]|nr:metallophosphoesterase family protein [Acidobacteriota bacterium]MBS1866034.1 metallophosphoesterase family protein [Acidobacteriota bacterium]
MTTKKIDAKLIGLISDTHGLLRPEAIEALRGSELIFHAGDVGKLEILDELRKIAPVIAIRGNVDTASWCSALNETELVETSAATFYLIHNLNDLGLNPAASGIHIVLSGHTHQPKQFQKDGVLYINPGSVGPRRFSLPICLARLDLSVSPWSARFIEME